MEQVPISTITTCPDNERADIWVRFAESGYKVVNGNMRLKAALSISGRAAVSDIDSGEKLEVVMSGDKLLVFAPADSAAYEKMTSQEVDAMLGNANIKMILRKPQSLAAEWDALPATSAHSGVVVAASDTEVIQHIGQGRHVAWPAKCLFGDQVEVGKQVDIDRDGEVKNARSGPAVSL